MRVLTADEAVAAIHTDDVVGIPLGPGQPPELIVALGRRQDWTELRIFGGLLTVLSDVFVGAGKVTNRKGQYDGVSVTTFATGTRELYDWLDGNVDVAFVPVDIVNNADVIARNRRTVTVNAALAIDVHGQVVADTIDGAQYTGIGGHQDFLSGPALARDARSLLCLPSTYTVAGELRSRIVPWLEGSKRASGGRSPRGGS